MSFGWCFSKFSKNWFHGDLWLPWYEKGGISAIFKRSSCLKPLVRIQNNFTGMFFGASSQNVFKEFWYLEKHGRQTALNFERVFVFTIYMYATIQTSFFSKPLGQFQWDIMWSIPSLRGERFVNYFFKKKASFVMKPDITFS